MYSMWSFLPCRAELSAVCDSETWSSVRLTCFLLSHCSPYSGKHPDQVLKDPRYSGMSSSVFACSVSSQNSLQWAACVLSAVRCRHDVVQFCMLLIFRLVSHTCTIHRHLFDRVSCDPGPMFVMFAWDFVLSSLCSGSGFAMRSCTCACESQRLCVTSFMLFSSRTQR